MMPRDQRVRLLLIDHDYVWSARMAPALVAAGIDVTVTEDYDYCVRSDKADLCQQFDLIILGCFDMLKREWKLIDTLVSQDFKVLVLPLNLTTTMLRALFKAGVADVESKPERPDELILLIQEAFDNITFASGFNLVMKG
jgi:DNA-binding NtrC family response regulator